MWLGSETNCSPDLARLPDQPQTSLGSLSCSFARAHCIRIEIVIKIWIEIGIGMFMTWSSWLGRQQADMCGLEGSRSYSYSYVLQAEQEHMAGRPISHLCRPLE